MTAKRPPIDWNNAATVFVPRVVVVCPECGNAKLVFVRSIKREFGNIERRYYCAKCDSALKIIAEPLPNFGSDENDFDNLET